METKVRELCVTQGFTLGVKGLNMEFTLGVKGLQGFPPCRESDVELLVSNNNSNNNNNDNNQ